MSAKTIQITTASTAETRKVAHGFAKLLKGGETIALVGNLGSGKTTFVKGLAKGLGIKKKITSPTFVLASVYQYKARPKRFFFHLDLYRLDRAADLGELGLKEMIADKKNIVAIEWPAKAARKLPKGTIMVELSHDKNNNQSRYIKIWSKK